MSIICNKHKRRRIFEMLLVKVWVYSRFLCNAKNICNTSRFFGNIINRSKTLICRTVHYLNSVITGICVVVMQDRFERRMRYLWFSTRRQCVVQVLGYIAQAVAWVFNRGGGVVVPCLIEKIFECSMSCGTYLLDTPQSYDSENKS